MAGIIGIARELEMSVIAEGVETGAEVAILRALGVSLFQGDHFAKPEVERLPPVPCLQTARDLAAAV